MELHHPSGGRASRAAEEKMDMRLMNEPPVATSLRQRIAQAEASARDSDQTVDRANEHHNTAGIGPGQTPSQGLQAALATARELLASTVDAVNPGTTRRELFGYVTQYRARLADLVAACPPGRKE
jgi:hypothetical protein